jgi:serine/threonine protein kinase
MNEEITQVSEIPPGASGSLFGTVVGDYRLGQLLGEGLTSQVYDAHNLIADQPCAVKLFRPKLLDSPVLRGRYQHDARQASRLQHVNIGAWYGLHQSSQGYWFAVMQRAEGTSLREMLEQNAPMSRRTLVPVMRELCATLAAVHSSGIAHRRLHPGNVMVNWADSKRRGALSVLDMGVYHAHPAIDDPTPVVERRARDAVYMAPEICKGQPADNRSDIYSLAAILYHMVTGKEPFLGDTFSATVQQHLGESPVQAGRLVSLPTELEEAIRRGLEKDPRKRIPSAEAFLSALDPLSSTGQHRALTRTPTGRHEILHTENAQFADIPDSDHDANHRADHHAPAHSGGYVAHPIGDTTTRQDASLAPPQKRRWWLWGILVLALSGFGGALTWHFLQTEDPSPTESSKRSTGDPSKGKSAARGVSKTARRLRPSLGRTPQLHPGAKGRIERGPNNDPAAKRNSLAAKRAAKSKTGTLIIVTDSDDSKIFVAGKLVGGGRTKVLGDLAPGKHTVRVEVAGKKLPERTIPLRAGQRRRVNFRAKP